jgi:sodium/potassium-transporting ATPase subunit alpha
LGISTEINCAPGDHPKTAEAIARKINLVLGETRESLSAKSGRPVEEIYEEEVSAVVVHGDLIDSLEGWQWDRSAFFSFLFSWFVTNE